MHRFIVMAALALVACDGNGTLPPDRTPYEGEDEVPLDCIPNLDGIIEADELPLVLGAEVTYLVSPPGEIRSVDTRGEGDADVRLWDWSIDDADDQLARLSTSTIDERWYADAFPPDAFIAPFDDGGSTETISRQDDEALYLLGVASREENPATGQTLLVYDEPIPLIRFPIETGTSYTASANIEDAVFNGIPYAARDTYEVRVAAVGELRLPTLTFTQAHQVQIQLTVEPALGDVTSVRQVSYFFECFGEIARATSQRDEPDPTFTEAAEVRRLGL
ncbi:MAG: hypothetical protein AAGA54_00860 [Myxococcota bacterium]